MPRKIILFHREIETRILTEALAVFSIFALLLAGIYVLEPAITGFVTVVKQVNHTDEVNLEFSENSEYEWNPENAGNLKSIEISGSKSKSGQAKVYIENNGARHLVFDSSRLAEKPSGAPGITGFAAKEGKKDDEDKENKTKDEDKEKGNGAEEKENSAPVWTGMDEFELRGELGINLSEHYYDADNDTLAYSSNNIDNVSITISNEMASLVPDENIDGARQAAFAAYDGKNITYKIISLIINTTKHGNITSPINITPINKTIINETPPINQTNETIANETIKKTININLEYGNNEFYDANNDGIEELNGIIDFAVENTKFSWDANKENVCARYEINSIDDEESTFFCRGSGSCCAFVGLESSREPWNDSLYLAYGSHGSSFNNIVYAQVLHVDYNLSLENPYADIAYSGWANLTAEFEKDLVEFEDACIDTCLVSGFNSSSYRLIIEAENTTLRIENIEYMAEERDVNSNPELVMEIGNISISKNKNYTLDLGLHFSDEDKDILAYSYLDMENITIRFEGNSAYIIPDAGFAGTRFTFIAANDSYGSAVSNVFRVEAAEEKKPKISIISSDISDSNWTIRFSALGEGNLTISGLGASYAEYFNDNPATRDELDILELKCDGFEMLSKKMLIQTENLWLIMENNSRAKLIDLFRGSYKIKGMLVENFGCNGTASYTAEILRNGSYAQQLNFSDDAVVLSLMGSNVQTADFSSGVFEIRDREDSRLAVFDSLGNANIRGVLEEKAGLSSDENDFAIHNSSNGLNLVITNPGGNLLIKGILNENQGLLAPGPNSFILENKTGHAVAYVDNNGSLFLKGSLTQNVLFG